ncbi:hypothetical protein OBV_00840 [Oscillibacter valericigenes Sjm18-20]|nr:hypothetical protein OBV_00840 [Oscillibacter valericigenes Sjm18-20]
MVNGSPVEMSLPAVKNCGRTYLALRFFTEALGLDTEWDSENGIVDIDDTVAANLGT